MNNRNQVEIRHGVFRVRKRIAKFCAVKFDTLVKTAMILIRAGGILS